MIGLIGKRYGGYAERVAKALAKKKKTESVCETMCSFWGYLLDLLICIYMLLILVVFPLYNEEGFTHIGTDKAMFFRNTALKCGMVIAPVLLLFWVYRLILFYRSGRRKVQGRGLSVTDCLVLGYGVAVVVSYVFSSYREEALWGATGWYMGTLPQLILVASYFLISRAWTARSWMILLVLPVSAVVFILGICNRFGYFPIDMKVENTFFISTIGNINWYCGYLVSVFFGVLFWCWKQDWEKLWQKVPVMAYLAIGFGTLITHGSSSGVLTMAVMFLVLFCLSVKDGRRMEAFWQEMLLFSAVSLITFLLCHYKVIVSTHQEESTRIFTNTGIPILVTVVSVVCYLLVYTANRRKSYPRRFFTILSRLVCGGIVLVLLGYLLVTWLNTKEEGALLAATSLSQSSMFRFSPGWGSNRGATWAAGVRSFGEQNMLHRLVGVGPDCMAAFIYNGASEGLLAAVKETFPAARLTNAHNEWLTVLVDVGILGFVSYAGIMISAIKRYIAAGKTNMVAGACGCCVLAYTINNMFSFQQSMGAATIFVVLAVGENYLRGKGHYENR